MNRVLIIGGNGFVGGRLHQQGVSRGYEVAIADMAEIPMVDEQRYIRCDIRDQQQLTRTFAAFRPNLVVNVAAIADIDYAEKEHERAWKVNVEGAANGARAARRIGAKYIWFSSDAVFSGHDLSYDETAPVNPVNFYGVTKKEGEISILKENPSAIIVRLSLILGMPVVKGNSFLAGLVDKFKKGERVNVPEWEIRTPVDVDTLCRAIYELYFLDYSGILHLGATDSINRFELCKRIAMETGYPEELVTSQQHPPKDRAPRHENGVLSVRKAQSVLVDTQLLTCEKTVKKAVSMIE